MLRTRNAVVVVAALLAACGGDDNSNNNDHTSTEATLKTITVTASTASIVPSATLQLTATGHYDDKSTQDLSATATWTSSSIAAATVSATGLVTGVANGSSTISASIGSVRGALAITVVQHVADATITSIAITPPDPSIGVSGTQQLTATATYSDATTKDISSQATWTTTDDTVVTVSQAGEVTGVKVGGPITIKAELDGVQGSTGVTVTAAPVLTVSSYIPKSGTTNARATTAFTVSFGSAVDHSTVTVQGTTGACSGSVQVSCDGTFTTCIGLGTPSYSPDSKQLTVAPATGLPAFATCQVKVKTAVHGADGGTMSADQKGPGVVIASDGGCTTTVVIDQVYGGGGEATATYQNDYVVLHNGGVTAQSVAGWSIQYAAATATTWAATNLTGSIPAGGYYLVSLASAGAIGAVLPTADATGTLDLNDAAGKVALVASTTVLTGACPLSQTVDFVGYGSANCSEAGVTAGAPSAILSASRVGDCRDTDTNGDDFVTSTPAVQSSATTAASCSCVAQSGSVAQIDACSIAPASMSVAVGVASADITVVVDEVGLTEGSGSSSAIKAQVGVGAHASTVDSTWTFSAATFAAQDADNASDDYTGTVDGPSPAGSYSYAGRASRDGVNWTYCDLDGNGSSGGAFDTAQEGALTTN